MQRTERVMEGRRGWRGWREGREEGERGWSREGGKGSEEGAEGGRREGEGGEEGGEMREERSQWHAQVDNICIKHFYDARGVEYWTPLFFFLCVLLLITIFSLLLAQK